VPTAEGAVWLAVSLVTFLGDPLVIAGLGLAVFWFGDRRSGTADRPDRDALWFASIVGALALSAALKAVFAIERPSNAAVLPGVAGMPSALVSVYTWIVGPGGYAFPSGHATAATVGWLGLAWVLDADDRRTLVLAGGVVAAVAASRVALGVHRPTEVLAGIALGVGYLSLTIRGLGTARRAFTVAGAIGAAAPVLVTLDTDGLAVAGVGLGMAAGELRQSGTATAVAIGAALVAVLLAIAAVRGWTGAAVTLIGAVGGGTAVAVRSVVRGRENGW